MPADVVRNGRPHPGRARLARQIELTPGVRPGTS